MAINKANQPNVDNSDPTNFPNARIRDNDGSGNGTGVNRAIYSDVHEFFAKLMRDAGIVYSDLPDNVATGYQLIEALVAKATKNDYLYTLSTSGGVMQLDLNISNTNLLAGESLFCVSAFNSGAETTIKGSGVLIRTVTITSAFKTGDYLQLVRIGASITIIRLADAQNLNVLVGELSYLKAASNGDEDTGTSTTKATTPASNKHIFERRIIGADSDTYLATISQNGLLSMEDKAIIDDFVNPVKNVGWFSGVDPGFGTIGYSYPRGGDVTSAVLETMAGSPGAVTIMVTMANTMPNTNYFVRLHVESDGTIDFDNDCLQPVFKKVSTTQFRFAIQEAYSTTQSLKIHIEAVAY